MRSTAALGRLRSVRDAAQDGSVCLSFILWSMIIIGGIAENDAPREINPFRFIFPSVALQEFVNAFDGGLKTGRLGSFAAHVFLGGFAYGWI